MSWAFGSYTGDGTGSSSAGVIARVLPTPGFTPVFALLINSAVGIFWKNASMTATSCRTLTSAGVVSTQIVNFSAGSVGVHKLANATGTLYYWAACDSTDCATGLFTGNGTTQNITGLSFTPGMVMTQASTVQKAVWKPANNGTGTLPFDTNGQFADGISMIDNGFTVGSDARVNGNAAGIFYAAFRDMPGQQEIVFYAGTVDDDNRLITTGWSPKWVLIKTEAASASKTSAIAVLRTSEMPAQVAGAPAFTSSSYWGDGTGVTNRLQNISDTGFTLGIGNQTEVNNGGFNYWAWCVGYPQASIANPATTVTRQASVV